MKVILVLLALTLLAVAADGSAPKRPPEGFKVTTKRADDAVEVRAEKDRAVFAVKSSFGIGEAVIERLDGKWPEAIFEGNPKSITLNWIDFYRD